MNKTVRFGYLEKILCNDKIFQEQLFLPCLDNYCFVIFKWKTNLCRYLCRNIIKKRNWNLGIKWDALYTHAEIVQAYSKISYSKIRMCTQLPVHQKYYILSSCDFYCLLKFLYFCAIKIWALRHTAPFKKYLNMPMYLSWVFILPLF